MCIRYRCNRVKLVIPLATLLLGQWVFGFSLVLTSPTQNGINMASYWLVCLDVSVRIVPVNKHQTSGKLLVAKHCTSKVIFTLKWWFKCTIYIKLFVNVIRTSHIRCSGFLENICCAFCCREFTPVLASNLLCLVGGGHIFCTVRECRVGWWDVHCMTCNFVPFLTE